MDLITLILAIIGGLAAIVGIAQYFEGRKEKKLKKQSEIIVLDSATPKVLHNLPNTDYGQFIGRNVSMI